MIIYYTFRYNKIGGIMMINTTLETLGNYVDGIAEKKTEKFAVQNTMEILEGMRKTVYQYFFIVNNTKYDNNTSLRFRNPKEVDDAYNEIIGKKSDNNKEPLKMKDLEIDYNGEIKLPKENKLEEHIVDLELRVAPNDRYQGVSLNIKFINIKNNYTEQMKFPIHQHMSLFKWFKAVSLESVVRDSLGLFLHEMFGKSEKEIVYNRVKNSYYENPSVIYEKD